MTSEIRTLLKLAKNPHYKMSPKEVEKLERYRNEQFSQRNNQSVVKHDTSFQVHNPKLDQENRKDNENGRNKSDRN